MQASIKNIAKLTTGVYSKTSSMGDVYYIQGRDFDQYGRLKSNLRPSVIRSNTIEKHILSYGDVLITAKGFDHNAISYKCEVAPAVASSMFILIRDIDQNVVLSDFLVWYLNHPNTQAYLARMAKGTALPAINKKIIGNLEVPIPSLEKQKIIMHIGSLRIREKQLKNDLVAMQETLINQQLLNALNQ